MSWTTNFNHTENTMTHEFNKDVKVITNFKTNKVDLIRFGERLSTYELDNFNVPDYTAMLHRIEVDARVLASLHA